VFDFDVNVLMHKHRINTYWILNCKTNQQKKSLAVLWTFGLHVHKAGPLERSLTVLKTFELSVRKSEPLEKNLTVLRTFEL